MCSTISCSILHGVHIVACPIDPWLLRRCVEIQRLLTEGGVAQLLLWSLFFPRQFRLCLCVMMGHSKSTVCFQGMIGIICVFFCCEGFYSCGNLARLVRFILTRITFGEQSYKPCFKTQTRVAAQSPQMLSLSRSHPIINFAPRRLENRTSEVYLFYKAKDRLGTARLMQTAARHKQMSDAPQSCALCV